MENKLVYDLSGKKNWCESGKFDVDETRECLCLYV